MAAEIAAKALVRSGQEVRQVEVLLRGWAHAAQLDELSKWDGENWEVK